MKTLLLSTLFAFFGFATMAQQKTTSNFYIDFEVGSQSGYRIWRDTFSNPSNCWRVGKPVKPVFTTAHLSQKVIATDTMNAYPNSDTSIFYISQIAEIGWAFPFPSYTTMRGWYFTDSDTLTDYGKIELSPNNGLTWIDLIKDTVYKITQPFDAVPAVPKPVLSGRSSGWKYFDWYLYRLADSFNVQFGDTVLMRFTFISDSTQTNRDGLMFDDISFGDWTESVESTATSIASAPSPNPATSTIHFTLSARQEDDWRIALFTQRGQKLKTETIRRGAAHDISVSELPPGFYYYTITGQRTGQTSSGSVIIADR